MSKLIVRQPAHVTTSGEFGSIYPFQAEGGWGSRGVYIGTDIYGGAFTWSPFDLYPDVITSPNAVLLGQLGVGKSSICKQIAARLYVFGYHSWFSDPKAAADGSDESEYCRLARAINPRDDPERGILRMYPNGPVRINPLEVGDGDGPTPEARYRSVLNLRGEIATAVVESALNRPPGPGYSGGLTPTEGSAMTEAVRHISDRPTWAPPPTLRDLLKALLFPTEEAAGRWAMGVEDFKRESRGAAHALGRLVEGDLAGMLDEQSSVRPQELAHAPIVVFDLHRVYHSGALEVILACVASWFRRVVRESHGSTKFLFVQDEGWAVLRRLAIARFFNERWKLARAEGVGYIMAIHRRSDMQAAGSEGSEQVRLALGLLSDAETRIIFRQASDEIGELADNLALTESERDMVPGLDNHTALWKVGQRHFVVRHELSPWERPIINTDEAMTA